MNRQQLDEIIALVDKDIGPAGYECVEAEWVGQNGTLRLYVDRKGADASVPQGIDLEGCVAVNRLLEDSQGLDGVFSGPYTLEVSSPGLERPLRRAGCFTRHIGARIRVRLQDAVDGRRRGTGRLLGVEEVEEPQVKMETEEGPWSFPLAQLEKASLVHDWDSGKPR